MKCISCGAEIELTDEKCPYCGRIITETAGHQAELKTYSEKNEKTKRGLAKVLSGNVPLIISAMVMVALFVANGVALYVKENAFLFRSDALRKESVKNYNAYSAEIEKYLEAGDYTGFAAFKEYHNIAEWEPPYDDLNLLWEVAEDYASLVSETESSILFGEDAERYNPESDVGDCQRVIKEFYEDFDYKKEEIDADVHREYIYDMRKKADIILKVYYGLDGAAREEFLAASDIDQAAYLEGVIIHE